MSSTGMESRRLIAITIASAVVGACAAGAQAAFHSDAIIAGVVAAATTAYAGFTWRLVLSAEADRIARDAEERVRARHALLGVLNELEQNAGRRGQTQAWYSHIPFERSALDDARPYRVLLPEALAAQLHQVDARTARYNSVAHYNQTVVRMGSGAADTELHRLSAEADASFRSAIDSLSAYLNVRPVDTGAPLT